MVFFLPLYINLETANSLDSFLNLLRQFINMCNPIRQLPIDQDTNFVVQYGAESGKDRLELSKMISQYCCNSVECL